MSLRPPALLALIALTSCFPRSGRVPQDVDTDTAIVETDTGDTDTDADADSDTDSDADVDTGVPDADNDGSPDDLDCNDADKLVHPGATEVCNGIDDDCEGGIDEGLGAVIYYADRDGDGYGGSTTKSACSPPVGYVTTPGDCNDNSAAIKPGVAEVCDGIDNNCTGGIDDGLVTTTYYLDGDADGVGGSTTKSACEQPAGYVTSAGDCNDNSAAIKPGAPETCNAVDNNCSGDESDASNAITYYRDADVDTYGTSGTTTKACSVPGGYVLTSTDCNDADTAIHPFAAEVCDGVDNDCEGGIDEGLGAIVYYADGDGDGVGGTTSKSACSPPGGYVTSTGDCNDADGTVKPGAPETCNNVDNNCSGNENDATNATTYYADTDGDTYGNLSSTSKACSTPNGYTTNSTDCNDAKAAVHPGAAETCDGTDEDCNGKGEILHTDTGDAQTDAMSLGATPGTVTVCGSSNRCPASRSSGDLGDQDWLRYSTTLSSGHFAGTLTWSQSADMDIIVMLWTGGNAGTRGDGTLTTGPEVAFYDFNTGGPPLGGDLYFRIACRAGTAGAWRADVVLP